jgi:hypothetical protein
MKFSFLLLLLLISNFGKSQTECIGLNGKATKKDTTNKLIWEGDFHCDTLYNGTLIILNQNDSTLSILVFKNKSYLYEIDSQTKEQIIQNKNNVVSEDGIFIKNSLYNGKKYIYDKDGILVRIFFFKNGFLYSEGKLE